MAQCVIVEYYVIQEMYSIKNEYAQVHIGNQPQAKYFYIPLGNDQGLRDKKYHINTEENILYIDI